MKDERLVLGSRRGWGPCRTDLSDVEQRGCLPCWVLGKTSPWLWGLEASPADSAREAGESVSLSGADGDRCEAALLLHLHELKMDF